MLRGAVIGFTVGATAGWCLAVAKFGRLPSRMEEGVVVANLTVPPIRALQAGAAGAAAGLAIGWLRHLRD